MGKSCNAEPYHVPMTYGFGSSSPRARKISCPEASEGKQLEGDEGQIADSVAAVSFIHMKESLQYCASDPYIALNCSYCFAVFRCFAAFGSEVIFVLSRTCVVVMLSA